ncbi:unnamed protein product [Urochloa humidicola]
MASGGGKAKASSWAAAMSVGTVQVLKDQAGLYRWNYAFRSAQQRARGAVAGTGTGGNALPSGSSGGAAAVAARRKVRQQEEELRTVMYLSNWGPNN